VHREHGRLSIAIIAISNTDIILCKT